MKEKCEHKDTTYRSSNGEIYCFDCKKTIKAPDSKKKEKKR